MLIKFFRSSFPVQFITIGVIGLLIWGVGAIHPAGMPSPQGPVPLYGILYEWLAGVPYFAMAIGFILVLFEAIWLNYIVLRHDLVTQNNSLTALFFLLFISLLPSYLTLTPINIASLFLLFIIRALLEAYNQSEPIELVYTAGFFVALASFFYIPALLFYGFLLICFLVYRSLKWREWLSSLIGLATPFLYLAVVYFLTDRFSILLALYSDFFSTIHITLHHIGWNSWILVGFMGLFALLGLWHTIGHIGEKTVELRKKTIILMWLLIWSFGTVLYTNDLYLYIPALLSISLSVFATNFYMRLRKRLLFELLLWVFIIILIANTALWPYFPVN